MSSKKLKHAAFVGLVLSCALATSCASGDGPDGGHFKPSISYADGAETFDGPARGIAAGGWKVFQPEGLPDWHGATAYNSTLWDLSQFSGGRMQDGRFPSPERIGTADIPLTAAMKADVRRFLDETRRNGGSLIVRIGYTWSAQVGCEPSNFEVVLGHLRDLCGIMADYGDVVVGVEAGVAGPWGEMHSSDYCRPEYMNRVLATYCDLLPEPISILVRSPSFICKMAGRDTQGTLAMLPFSDARLRRLGMFNDGYLGTWRDYGTWSGDFTRERGSQMLKTFADHPYGGELAYVSRDWVEKNKEVFDIGRWNLVKDWYDCHLNYLRNLGAERHTLANYIRDELVFSVGKYKFDGMPSLAEYEGVGMHKFLLDHMGYRFVVRDARLPGAFKPESPSLVGLEVENTGFGRLLLPSKAEVVFVQNGEAFAAIADDKADFSAIPGGAKKRVGLRIVVPKGLKRGKCEVLVRVSAPLKDERPGAMPRRTIRFANAGMWNETFGANSLGSSEVR